MFRTSLLSRQRPHRALHSFPTRRSSDLGQRFHDSAPATVFFLLKLNGEDVGLQDRKSTRLNSSHRTTSYAVFCLKKKTKPYCRIPASASAVSNRHTAPW